MNKARVFASLSLAQRFKPCNRRCYYKERVSGIYKAKLGLVAYGSHKVTHQVHTNWKEGRPISVRPVQALATIVESE